MQRNVARAADLANHPICSDKKTADFAAGISGHSDIYGRLRTFLDSDDEADESE